MPHSTLHGKKDFSTQEIEYLSHLRFAIDQHAIVSIANAAGDIIDVNDKFCEISGYIRMNSDTYVSFVAPQLS